MTSKFGARPAAAACDGSKGSRHRRVQISMVGVVGVPSRYGGFETLVENLVRHHASGGLDCELTVYCSSPSYDSRPTTFLSAELRYLPLRANGVQSILYDFVGLCGAVWRRVDAVLLLGVSGALAIPLVRLFSRARVITNIDGIEWRRAKWNRLIRRFLRLSERVAIRHSDIVITDNTVVAEYVLATYGVRSETIAYGGDHVLDPPAAPLLGVALPSQYAFSLCRIEPENNVHVILDAFVRLSGLAVVIVGNWESNEYGRSLRSTYGSLRNIVLLDSIYDVGILRSLRENAYCYVHGHSAGGTNPSLVEAMHFGLPVVAFDCDFNRSTTQDRAIYFTDAESLRRLIARLTPEEMFNLGREMRSIAQARYMWKDVARRYFSLLCSPVAGTSNGRVLAE